MYNLQFHIQVQIVMISIQMVQGSLTGCRGRVTDIISTCSPHLTHDNSRCRTARQLSWQPQHQCRRKNNGHMAGGNIYRDWTLFESVENEF